MNDGREGFLTLSDEVMADLGISTLDILSAIETALKSEGQGKTWTTPKTPLLPGDGRYILTTLSCSDSPRITVVKCVSVSPGNGERGLNGIEGSIIVKDSLTGLLIAVMQAGWITAVRTAGLSGVVARRLANPKSRCVTFVGAGQQARSHLQTFSDLFPLKDVRIMGRGQANIDRLTKVAKGMGLAVTVLDDPAAALEGTDLVVTSVPLSFDIPPFLDARHLKPGAFATITDASVPWCRDAMTAFGTIVIDDMEQERQSAKKMVDLDQVAGDLKAMVVNGDGGKYDPAKSSAFIFRGLAIGDFAVAGLAYQKAIAAGVGTPVRW